MQKTVEKTDHACARCGKPTAEDNLVWLDREDDFVCTKCHAKSEACVATHKVRKDNQVKRLAALRA